MLLKWLSYHSMCIVPYQGILLPHLFFLPLKAFLWSSGWDKRKHTCIAYFTKSKTRSNGENRSYNQTKMCMCAEFCGWNSCFAWLFLWYIFVILSMVIFSFLFFSSPLFFYIAHTFLHNTYEESCWKNGVFIWMKGMFLRNFQCRSRHKYMWSVRDLDLKSMKRISQESQTIWQSSMQK